MSDEKAERKTDGGGDQKAAGGGGGSKGDTKVISKKVPTRSEEARRNLKWTGFSKPKVVFGFDLLSPVDVPSMAHRARGMAIAFETIYGWRAPKEVNYDDKKHEYKFQLSLSLFHLKSGLFFGTTWLGKPIVLNDEEPRRLPDVIDIEYEDMVYLITRLTDPSCIAVIEIVVSKQKRGQKMILAQYGCGWTILNLFAPTTTPTLDVEDVPTDFPAVSCPFFEGSPRDLLLYKSAVALESKLTEMKGCTLQYMALAHKKLTRGAQRLLSENAIVGRYDVVPGLKPHAVTMPEDTEPTMMACIGDEVRIDDKRGSYILPRKPSVAIPISLRLSNCTLDLPDRLQMERRLCGYIAKSLASPSTQTVVTSRSLKIALHNGHTLIGGDWQTYHLEEDKNEKDILITTNEKIDVNGFAPHELMGLVIMLEYTVGTPVPQERHLNTHTILNSTLDHSGNLVTTISMGAGLYLPYDGKNMLLSNMHSGQGHIHHAHGEDIDGVEMELRVDDINRILSSKATYVDLDETGENIAVRAKKLLQADSKTPKSDSQGDDSRDAKGAKRLLNESVDGKTKIVLEEEDDDEGTTGIMVEFDLTILTEKGELKHGDDIEITDLTPSTSDRPVDGRAEAKGGPDSKEKPEAKIRPSSRPTPRPVDDDAVSVVESVVSGEVGSARLNLDAGYYGGGKRHHEPDAMSVSSGASVDPRFIPPRNQNSLMARAMQTRVGPELRKPTKTERAQSDVLDDVPDGPSGTAKIHRDGRVVRDTMASAAGSGAYVRELSRAARSRLSRHGIDGAMHDSAGMSVPAVAVGKRGTYTAPQIDISDIMLEARDDLCVHDISIQFAGFRAGGSANKQVSAFTHPHSVFFSYQFYTCQPTRTEPMRLLPADDGQMRVLVRDEPGARNDAPLSLRYTIDTASVCPTESYDFAEYLAHHSLFVDVWDAEGLTHLGTTCIPLRKLMRQGQPVTRCAIECDVINADIMAQSEAGITTSVLSERGPVAGVVVGAVNIIMTNYGLESKGTHKHRFLDDSAQPKGKGGVSETVPSGAFNWRALGANNENVDVGQIGRRHRPKTSVRARPLSESTPELSSVLQAAHDHKAGNDTASMRSLATIRGAESMHTLTYDDVIALFKRFQGTVKGTVQYAGPMLKLLDVPSSHVAMKKLVKVYQTLDRDGERRFESEMSGYADAEGRISLKTLQEFFRMVFDKFGVNYRPEELLVLAKTFISDENGETSIKYVASTCRDKADRQDWTLVGKRFRNATQKATIAGMDVEQVLSEYDTDGDHFISISALKEFMRSVSKYGKFSAKDVMVIARHFSELHADMQSSKRETPIALREVMAFLGKQYVGNTEARFKTIVHAWLSSSKQADIDTHEKKGAFLQSMFESSLVSGKGDGKGKLGYDEWESSFNAFGVYSELSHAQIRKMLTKLDTHRKGSVLVKDVLRLLSLPYKTAGDDVIDGIAGGDNEYMNAESLMKLLLERVQVNGVAVDEAFRHFDADGNGSITEEELIQGMDNLGIFDNIPQWKYQVSRMVQEFDTSKNGLVELKEFFHFLGADYAPDIAQKMTKIFGVAKEQGLDVVGVFNELDKDGNGQLTPKEIKAGLEVMGFSDITEEDCISVIKVLDKSARGVISKDAFVTYFENRVDQANAVRHKKNTARVAKRFRMVMDDAKAKGATSQQLFEHFDKDHSGGVSVSELETILKTLPHFKGLDDKEISELLRILDADDSGTVDLREFKQFLGEDKGDKDIVYKLLQGWRTAKLRKITFEDALRSIATLTPAECRRAKAMTEKDITPVVRELEALDGSKVGKTSVPAFVEGIEELDFERDLRSSFESKLSHEKGSRSRDLQKKLQSALREVEKQDLSVGKVFEHFDTDKSGALSVSEFKQAMLKIPSFKSISDDEIDMLIETLDADRNGSISIREFMTFVDTDLSARAEEKSSESKGDESKGSDGPRGGHGQQTPQEAEKERFIRHLHRIAEADGGIEGLIAYLDRDEDGLISIDVLHRMLKREGVYEDINERDVDKHLDKLKPKNKDKSEFVSAVSLLRFAEGRHDVDGNDDLMEGEKDEPILEAEYEFSNDPEIRSLEKKLRSVGRSLYRKGVDVEGLFRAFDGRETGMVRRTEFIEALSKIGLYILEKGKSFDAAADSEGKNDIRRQQMAQIGKLKGRDSYAFNASRAAKKYVMNGGSGISDHATSEFQEHLESMALINWYRQSQKRLMLQRVLSHSLASNVNVYPRLGQTLFFEQPITNPFGHEERFIIDISSEESELRLVTAFDEWLHLRATKKPCTGELGAEPVEADMFDKDGYGNLQVALLPHETLHLPFTFMSLVPYIAGDNSRNKRVRLEDRSKGESKGESKRAGDSGEGKSGDGGDSRDDEDPRRYVEVRVISGTHGHIVAVLKVNVFPRPHCVHRNFRFLESENTIMKRRLRLVNYDANALGSYAGEPGAASKYIHCVDCGESDGRSRSLDGIANKLVVEWAPSSQLTPGESASSLDVLIRYRCGAFPTTGRFLLLIYDDPFQSCLHEVWSVIVATRQRIDVHGMVGSAASVDLVVRGDRFARRARACAAHSFDEIRFSPQSVFQLTPGAFNRVLLNTSFRHAGVRRVEVNLVDTDSRELISSWLLTATASAPAVVRTYDVNVHVGDTAQKKIAFENPWRAARRFVLSSSDESLMKPKAEIMDIGALGSTYLRLWFAAAKEGMGVREVYLFLNDEQGSNEESFLFRIHPVGGAF